MNVDQGLLRGFALTALAVLVSACGGSSSSGSPAPAPTGPETSVPAPNPTPTPTPTPLPAPAPSPVAPSDTLAPTVGSVTPEAGSDLVATNSDISAFFSEAILESTLSGFTVDGPAPVDGLVNFDSSTLEATFRPGRSLRMLSDYTATLSATITDMAGNPLAAAYDWHSVPLMVRGRPLKQ